MHRFPFTAKSGFFSTCWGLFFVFFWFFFRVVFLFVFLSFWGAMLGSFLGHVGLFFRSFFRSFFVMFFGSFLGRFGVRFWVVFGGQIGSNFEYVIFWCLLIFLRFFNGFCTSEGVIFVLCRFFFRFVFCIDFWSLFGPILGSFWEALGGPNPSFWPSILSIDFWSFFGSILGSSWEAFGGILGVEIGHFWHRFLVYFWMSFRVCVYVSSGVWTCACVSPRGRPRAAKCGQKRPKRAQNWAKSGPRVAQNGQ